MALRVIAGEAKGRRLRAPRRGVRPTAERVRGAIFAMLGSRWNPQGAVVLDLFAGSGALGIEALSRGAARAVFVEHEPRARRTLAANLAAFGGRATIAGQSALQALRRLAREGQRFDAVFVDPPYERGWVDRVLRALAAAPVVSPGGWVVLEHSRREMPAPAVGPFALVRQRRYGDTVVSVFTT